MRETKCKPYNRCLYCRHRLEKRCDGPRTSAMPLARWCEFIRDLKEVTGITNAEIAERTGISIKTIERLMSPNPPDQDIRRETARLIEDTVIGSSNKYPCYLAFEDDANETSMRIATLSADLERAISTNTDYSKALDGIHESYAIEMRTIREDAQKKISFLLEEITRLREDVDHWRNENLRKGRLIDNYMEKIVSR